MAHTATTSITPPNVVFSGTTEGGAIVRVLRRGTCRSGPTRAHAQKKTTMRALICALLVLLCTVHTSGVIILSNRFNITGVGASTLTPLSTPLHSMFSPTFFANRISKLCPFCSEQLSVFVRCRGAYDSSNVCRVKLGRWTDSDHHGTSVKLSCFPVWHITVSLPPPPIAHKRTHAHCSIYSPHLRVPNAPFLAVLRATASILLGPTRCFRRQMQLPIRRSTGRCSHPCLVSSCR